MANVADAFQNADPVSEQDLDSVYMAFLRMAQACQAWRSPDGPLE